MSQRGISRLVYAPRARAFIRSSNLTRMNGSPTVLDVSKDIVSGSVTRNVGSHSSASLVLRNRNRKYTRFENTKTGARQPVFLPMDMITIFLQRIAGKPIQVFTGYLDRSPYYQIYPGDCEVTATCTLKRLAYQWFDPGLPFFRNFIQSHGWAYTPDGQATPNGDMLAKGIQNQDAGFGQLLYDFMTELAGWAPENVLVSKLDPLLPQYAAEMLNAVVGGESLIQNVNRDVGTLRDYLKIMMSINVNPKDPKNPDKRIQTVIKTTKDLVELAGSLNLPPVILVYAAIALSGYDPTYVNTSDPATDTAAGYGLWGFRPSWADSSRVVLFGTDEPVPYADLFDTDVVLKRIIAETKMLGDSTAQALIAKVRKNPNDVVSVNQLAYTYIGQRGSTTMSVDAQTSTLNIANKYLQGLKGTDDTVFATPVQPPIETLVPVTWNDDRLAGKLTLVEHTLAELHRLFKTPDSAATLLYWIKGAYPNLSLGAGTTAQNTWLTIVCDSKDDSKQLDSLYQSLIGKPQIGFAAYSPTKGDQKLIKGNQEVTPGKDDKSFFGPKGSLTINVLPGADFSNWSATAPPVDSTRVGGSLSDPNVSDLKISDLAKISANSAFLSQFSFPNDYIQSVSLTGQKSLYNDVSMLEAVEQFCQASLRTFMSLPDGRFCAFYPDYFGATREPYWWVRDIEITNMGIQMNDEKLATHVYTPGSTYNPLQNGIDFLSLTQSLGVATIYMTPLLESFIAPGLISEGGAIDPQAFINHFGIRVYKQDMPIIKHPFYEFLMAWQKFMQLWSATFLTLVEFTFQPEIMAGGLVGFSDHGIQMFVDSVTHTFDYTSGFTTVAEMSAPSIMKDASQKDIDDLPGFALAGGALSVGAA